MPDDREGPRNAAGTEDTVAAPVAQQATLRPPPSMPAGPSTAGSSTGGGSTARVGDDLRAVSLSRFGTVDRERFEMLGELARGGLGRVYRARDPRTGRVVALKEVLRPSADLLVRFAREALVTANLQHPSIVPVYEVGRWPGGEPFYAMKLVQGRALDAVIQDARTTAARVALVPHIIAVADALAYAHSEHVIHRDLKPANVLVGAYGETVVIDWGLARNLAGDPGGADESLAPTLPPLMGVNDGSMPGQTVAGAVVGTPAYMPPEQARGLALDERADVYAIGAILYHALSGERPYRDAHTLAAVLTRVGSGPPRPLAELVPDLPAELTAIVERAMARAPAARYPTALELAADLRRYVSGQLVGAHTYTRWELLRRWVARYRAAVLTASIALAALGVFGVVSVRRIAAERDEARRQHDRAEHQRAAAQASRELAERRFADSLEELGRQAGRDGGPERALVFLAAARAASPADRPVLDLMLGQARAAFAGLRAIAPGHLEGTVSADLSPDGTRLYSTSSSQLRAWDVAARTERWTAAGYHHVAVSPDGRWLLVAGYQGAVAVLDATDGTVGRTWTLPPRVDGDEVVKLAWAPDNTHFAVGTKTGQVAVGTTRGGALAAPAPHHGEVYSLAFAPDGRHLVACGKDGAGTLRDPTSAAVRTTLATSGGAEMVSCLWLDAHQLVSGDADGHVRRWTVDDRGATPTSRLEHGPDLYGLAAGQATGSGAWLLTYGDGATAKLWDLERATVRATLPGHTAAVSDALASGRWLVTADEAGNLFVWDPATGEPVQNLPREGLESLAARGDTLVTFGEGRTRLWQLAPETSIRRLAGHTARVRDLVFDRRGVVWTASNDGSARGVDVATGAVRVLGQGGFHEPVVTDPLQSRVLAPNPHGLRSLTLTPDGARIVTAGEDGTIAVWDAITGAPITTWPGHQGRVRKVVFTPAGDVAYSVGDTTVRRWDVATGKETARADLGDDAWDVALLGRDVVVTFSDNKRALAFWRADTLAPHAVPEIPIDRLRDLIVDGDRLIVAIEDQVLALGPDGKVVARAAHYGAFAADLAPGGGPIATGDPRSEVVLHDRTTLAPVRWWRIGDGIVAAVRFRADGAVLATAGGRRVRLWDPATGRVIAVSPELPAALAQLAWSPDGRWLAIGGGSGTIWLWDLQAPAGADLARFVRCVSPWRIEESALAAAPYDADACAVLGP